MSIAPSVLRRISASTIERYVGRLRQHGVTAQALGWGAKEHQTIRFSAACSLGNPRDATVLDFGCGFGDLFAYMKEHDQVPKRYVGVDLLDDFVAAARERHPDGEFVCGGADFDVRSVGAVDVIFVLGLMNFRQSEVANLDYARAILDSLWPMAERGLVVDFLSAQRTPDYPAEDWVYYYQPAEVIDLASRYSPRWILKQDYPPIPQREMMLWVEKPQ